MYITDVLPISELIRNKRRILMATQKECAQMIGVSQACLCRWEQGKRGASAANILKLSIFLGVAPRRLL